MKIRNMLAVFLSVVMLMGIAIQGVAHAVRPPQVVVGSPCTIDVDRNSKHTSNPLEIDVRRGDYRQLFGDATIHCTRKKAAVKHHDRIAGYVVLEKWKPRYKKYMTYRTYAFTEKWKAGQDTMIFPGARIICDGHAHYRVRAGVYTYDVDIPAKAYPSMMITDESAHIPLCIGTNPKDLRVVNNP